MKILLAVDASASSENAVQAVAARPWPPDTTIEIINVVQPSYVWDVPSLVEGMRQTSSEHVQAVANRLRSSGFAVTTRVLFGDPRAVIVDQAAEMGADLVVVGSHGSTGLGLFLLGSVSKAVLRYAPCSVEIVRGQAPQPGAPGALKILLATDGSEYSEAAARSVAGRPWPAGTEVRVFSAVELHIPLFSVPYPPYLNAHAMENLRAEAMRHAEEALLRAEQIVSDAGLAKSSKVAVPLGTPQELILKEAADWGPDLIVLGSHGRRGLNRFMLGSVSEAVALHVSCSVEVIRQPRK